MYVRKCVEIYDVASTGRGAGRPDEGKSNCMPIYACFICLSIVMYTLLYASYTSSEYKMHLCMLLYYILYITIFLYFCISIAFWICVVLIFVHLTGRLMERLFVYGTN